MISQESFSQVERKIVNAPILTDPCPHIHVENVFPEETYRELISNLPEDSDYTPFAPPYEARLSIDLTPDGLKHLQLSVASNWLAIAHWLASQRLLDVATEKFAPWLAGTFQLRKDMLLKEATGSDGVRVSPRSLLLRDRKQYKLGPHTDSPTKLFTFLFYIPRSANMQEFGTAFFRPKDPGYKCWRTVHHDFEGFEPVKVCPYVPNSMVAFVKTETSFHGVLDRDHPDVDNRGRDLFLYSPEIGVRADAPAILELKHQTFAAATSHAQ
jgi:hypothetical protein